MKERTIQLYDKSNMRQLLIDFYKQVTEAVSIGTKAKINLNKSSIKNIVVTGLGGSAIGSDILRSYLASDFNLPFVVNRHYFLPDFVDKNSLVVVSSYSGNTEETIAAHQDANKRGAQVLCITSGGETEKLAKKYNHPLIKIPKGYPPRAALGFSFFPLLMAFVKVGLIKNRDKEIKETISFLKKKSLQYQNLDAEKNPTLVLAQKLFKKIPIIYSSADRFDSVNIRWRGQLCENSKVLAFGHTLPEMNHNELVGWKVLKRQMSEMAVIFLRDKGDHKRVQIRMNIMQDIMNEYAGNVININSSGNSPLTRIFSLIYFGDWVSYYLAIINGIDPTPVTIIDYLKNELAKV